MAIKKSKDILLRGANMDIDLNTKIGKISWKQDKCPWNSEEKSKKHKCAVKDISICKYFKGIKPIDVVICSFRKKK